MDGRRNVLHGLRVMEGQPLYVEPSSEFIPFIYPPLYSWLLGWGSFVFGLDYSVGRGIFSSLFFVGKELLISIGRKENYHGPFVYLWGPFFVSTYENSGTFMDLVRTDSLVVALVGWSLVFLQKFSGRVVFCCVLLFLRSIMLQYLEFLWLFGFGEHVILRQHWNLLPIQQFQPYYDVISTILKRWFLFTVSARSPLRSPICWISIFLVGSI